MCGSVAKQLEVSGGAARLAAAEAGRQLAGTAGRQRWASARQLVGQQIDTRADTAMLESHSKAGRCDVVV